jgi:hypothetical protein
MTKSHETEDRRLRRKTAAFRLKHDVGKAVRWSAPETRETDPGALRARLSADLLRRPSDGSATRDVLENFFEWKREEGHMFDAGDADLQAVERAVAEVRRLAPRLLALEESSSSSPSSSSSLPPPSSLVALDDACVEVARACTAFYRRVAVEEGPEIVRPFLRRGSGS